MASQQYAVANWFSNAHQSKNLMDAEAEIQQLKREIDQLRQQNSSEQLNAELNTLSTKLQSQSGTLSIPIEQIQPNPEQPRQTFLPSSIESISYSLEIEGQLEPIILIEGDPYLIFDGERRWRGAQQLGLVCS
jgi:ParB family chromosome partitioning protein